MGISDTAETTTPAAIMSIDIGTTSSRVVIYDHDATTVASAQREHARTFPHPGWVESDPLEIWHSVRELMALALTRASFSASDIAAIGITNQRETVVAWDRETGKPLHPAIIWQDTRTENLVEALRETGVEPFITARTGLQLSSYFSALKIRWLIDNVPAVTDVAHHGSLALGTIDSWILWNLTAGSSPSARAGAVFATDITNASRTLLMDIHTGQWSEELITTLGLDPDLVLPALPEIRPSSGDFGVVTRAIAGLAGTPITGILGDQQAAAFGQAVFESGESKNTYGTGCFVVHNTGTEAITSRHGLLTTVAYQLAGEPVHYALEGSVAHAGSVIQWLHERLGLFSSASEIQTAADAVDDNGGVYFVPAFSGLFAPYWRHDARGSIFGLTDYVTKHHIARAGLEATAFQSYDVLQAVAHDVTGTTSDTGSAPGAAPVLKVDGGMSVNDTLMQFQADLLGITLARPEDIETTARGAAFAAGLAVNFWSGLEELRQLWSPTVTWEPTMDDATRKKLLAGWKQAIDHTVGWVSH